MFCPEGSQIPNDAPKNSEKVVKDAIHLEKKSKNKFFGEGSGSIELKSFKIPKTWKKSISNFFRNQLRITKSNDGDGPTDRHYSFQEKPISPEHKWQSLGKVFRRQSFANHWERSSKHQEEGSLSQCKGSGAVRKVISNYLGNKADTQANARK